MHHLTKLLTICLLSSSCLMLQANDEVRKLQYTPTNDGYISCSNGTNLYTRALYGSNTLWRLETSDMPIFGAYHKTDNRNIHFTFETKTDTLRLDSVAECTALYQGGERIYKLSDPKFEGGTLTMTVVASPDAERAIWEIKAQNMPKGATITAHSCATASIKLNRSGDLGADPKNAFAPDPEYKDHKKCTEGIGGNGINKIGLNGKEIVKYIEYADRNVSNADQKKLAEAYKKAQQARQDLISQVTIHTPDPYINTLATSLMAGADGIWDGKCYQHGAVGWRMPLNGWRGAYAADFLGWHDRARTHFDAYAASQVTEVPPTIQHPNQDKSLNMARAEKQWGTQMYSNGYICRNPERNDQMHHYDMNLVYIDQLLWHIKWTGDLDYARKMWPTIERSLAWEKRNFDPNDDGLYDAYCCIWASDALYYNSGAVTHATAYNYRANKIAAEIASKIGVDPTPYQTEAKKILDGINEILWIEKKGVWAEHRDIMGNQLIHDHPALWTIYHAIDSDVATPQQAYSATGYIERNIPHIPVTADGLKDEGYAVISTTDWLPYSWSINNVAFAEMYHTALAFWQAGKKEEAYKLLKSVMLDGMFIGDSPGNIGQISYYDAARGECYRDFADPIGILSRTLVQGLFGYTPDALNRKVTLNPGWPTGWQYASIKHPDFAVDFKRIASTDHYTLQLTGAPVDTICFKVDALREKVSSVKVNGVETKWTIDPQSVGRPTLSLNIAAQPKVDIEISWDGSLMVKPKHVEPMYAKTYRPLYQGDMTWQAETPVETFYNRSYIPQELGLFICQSGSGNYETVDMTGAFNANVTDIFRNQYLEPRSPFTTLQIPTQGIGEWCHPKDSADIDDTALRAAGGIYTTPEGIPFATPATGPNVVYTSMFNNYPTSASIPLSGKAKAINLLMAGSTNHMQCYVNHAYVDVIYADDSSERLPIIAPYNWCPIEQDYYTDRKAFTIPTPAPYRLSLKTGHASRTLGQDLSVKEPARLPIDGGAAQMLAIVLNPDKELKELRLTTTANEIVVGILAATYVK